MKVGEYAEQCTSLLLDCDSRKLRRRVQNLYEKYDEDSMISFTRILLGEYNGMPPTVDTIISAIEGVTDCSQSELYDLFREHEKLSSVAEVAYRRTDGDNQPKPNNEVVGCGHHIQTTSTFSVVQLDEVIDELYKIEDESVSKNIIQLLFRQCSNRREVKWVFYGIVQDIAIYGERKAVIDALERVCDVDEGSIADIAGNEMHKRSIADMVTHEMYLSDIYAFYVENGYIPSSGNHRVATGVGI